MRATPLLLLALPWIAACGPDDPVDPDPTSSLGLPEGSSTWTGRFLVAGIPLSATVEIDNDGGDLTATATVTDDPEEPVGYGTGIYTLTGTHAPGSGRIALSPDSWVQAPNVEVELNGFAGGHAPETDEIMGHVADYASGSDNTLQGGAATFTRAAGDGDPTPVGAGEDGLGTDPVTFAGTLQCTGPVRDTTLTLTAAADGALSGALTVGNPGLDAPLGTFSVSGVHNRDTGAIVLVPGVWDVAGTHSILTFFVSGRFDPATGRFDGDQFTNAGPCPAGTWQTAIAP